MFKISGNSIPPSAAHLTQAKSGWKNLLNRTDPGFLHLVNRQKLWESAQVMGDSIRQQFTQMVVVGIGGSSLGAKAIAEVLGQKDEHQLHFLENVDPVEFARLFSAIDPKFTAWVFISKSGTTLETLSLYDFVAQEYKTLGLEFGENTFYVSEFSKNPLSDQALRLKRPCLEIPKDVGGRYSVLTPVGMLPAAFLGYPVKEFFDGAALAMESEEQVCQFVASVLESFSQKKWITVFWFYSSVMKNAGGWIQQLWAESLAKKVDREQKPAARVSTPMVAIGPCDQHSILQQVVEGEKDKLVVFFQVENLGLLPTLKESAFAQHNFWTNRTLQEILDAERKATSSAVAEEGVANLTIHLPDLSPKTLGYLFMYFQLAVGVLGEVLNIDAFNQPGVELGKRLAKKILSSR